MKVSDIQMRMINSSFFCCYFYLTDPPLFVIEFLHRIIDVFEDYFGECSETSLKDNYVIVYEVRRINFSPWDMFSSFNV